MNKTLSLEEFDNEYPVVGMASSWGEQHTLVVRVQRDSDIYYPCLFIHNEFARERVSKKYPQLVDPGGSLVFDAIRPRKNSKADLADRQTSLKQIFGAIFNEDTLFNIVKEHWKRMQQSKQNYVQQETALRQ